MYKCVCPSSMVLYTLVPLLLNRVRYVRVCIRIKYDVVYLLLYCFYPILCVYLIGKWKLSCTLSTWQAIYYDHYLCLSTCCSKHNIPSPCNHVDPLKAILHLVRWNAEPLHYFVAFNKLLHCVTWNDCWTLLRGVSYLFPLYCVWQCGAVRGVSP